MAFINWGEETPEQLKARKEMEERMLFEQAAYQSAMAAAAAAGSGRVRPNELVGVVDWLATAPSGAGSLDHNYANFDDWATDKFGNLYDVRRLRISATSANAHVHSELPWSDLAIQLYNPVGAGSWVTVWTRRLENPNYPDSGSDDFFVDGIDVTFPQIEIVQRIRFTSNPGSDQTYHDWDQDPTLFSFYR